MFIIQFYLHFTVDFISVVARYVRRQLEIHHSPSLHNISFGLFTDVYQKKIIQLIYISVYFIEHFYGKCIYIQLIIMHSPS